MRDDARASEAAPAAGAADGDVTTDETGRPIASDKIEGTPVYNRRGEHLGPVHDVMIDKVRARSATP